MARPHDGLLHLSDLLPGREEMKTGIVGRGLAWFSDRWQSREEQREQKSVVKVEKEDRESKCGPDPKIGKITVPVVERASVPDRAFRRREHRSTRKRHQYAVTNEQTENEAGGRGLRTRRVR